MTGVGPNTCRASYRPDTERRERARGEEGTRPGALAADEDHERSRHVEDEVGEDRRASGRCRIECGLPGRPSAGRPPGGGGPEHAQRDDRQQCGDHESLVGEAAASGPRFRTIQDAVPMSPSGSVTVTRSSRAAAPAADAGTPRTASSAVSTTSAAPRPNGSALRTPAIVAIPSAAQAATGEMS